jgi:hypothetical protein
MSLSNPYGCYTLSTPARFFVFSLDLCVEQCPLYRKELLMYWVTRKASRILGLGLFLRQRQCGGGGDGGNIPAAQEGQSCRRECIL